MEEDAGKLTHDPTRPVSMVDFNRTGVPLIEIVSEPDLRTPEEAAEYMRTIRGIVRCLGVSDGNMEQGSLRCDANVSVRPRGQEAFGTRTELKNLNSFRFVEKAINFEIERQIDVIEDGGEVVQETRLYDANKDETRSMRSKEEANDYRYFPDPDLLPVEIDAAYIEAVRETLPELPDAPAVWLDLVEGARSSLDVFTFYFSPNPDAMGPLQPVLAAVEARGRAGEHQPEARDERERHDRDHDPQGTAHVAA